MNKKQIEAARKEAKQTIYLHELKNIAYRIAKYNLETTGVYFCILDGVKTEVIKEYAKIKN